MTMNLNKHHRTKEPEDHHEEEDFRQKLFPLIQALKLQPILYQSQNKILTIENIFFNPQLITIVGYDQLRSIPGQDWKSRILSLFYDANLPQFWVLDLWQDNNDNQDIPHKVIVQLITYHVKLYVASVLTHFFSSQNKANIYILLE
jgi:hypothetical protein